MKSINNYFNTKNLRILLTNIIVFFFLGNIYSKTINKIVIKKNSYLKYNITQNDSLLILEYSLIKELFERKKYKLSLEKSLQLYELSEVKNNQKIKTLSSYLIAEIFSKTKNFKKSLAYFKNTLKVYENYNLLPDQKKQNINVEDYSYALNLLKIGGIYHYLNEIDDAKHYYNRVLTIKSLNDNSLLKIKSEAYSNLSAIYTTHKNFDKAVFYAKKAIEINQKINDRLNEAAALSNLASIYLKQNKLEKAKEIYFKGIQLIKHNKGSEATSHKEVFYDNLAWTLYNQKNYIAYEYLDKSFQIRDSLREIELKESLVKIEAKHNVDVVRKEEEVKLLKARAKSKTILEYSILVGILLLITAGYFKYRQKRLRLTLSIKDLKLEKLKTESQVKILNATLDGKESERKQIAETLHDDVSTMLSSANLHLQASKKQFNGETPIEIKKSQTIITEAAKKIRDLSHTLVSSVLLKFGLRNALMDLSEKYSNSDIHIYIKVGQIERYDQNFEIKVYNIIQELVNNILKHSKANKASVTLTLKKNCFYINIEDNGVGFNAKETAKKDGLGINQIHARIQMMKGSFKIKSADNSGTKIAIILPIQEKATLS